MASLCRANERIRSYSVFSERMVFSLSAVRVGLVYGGNILSIVPGFACRGKSGDGRWKQDRQEECRPVGDGKDFRKKRGVSSAVNLCVGRGKFFLANTDVAKIGVRFFRESVPVQGSILAGRRGRSVQKCLYGKNKEAVCWFSAKFH